MTRMIKSFLLNSDNIERDSGFWNMIGSMLMAFQSVIFLVVLSHTIGLVASGIFTIAYANANLMLTVGKYGMRSFQVSDVNKQFGFREYLCSRYITTVSMVVISIGYIVFSTYKNGYSLDKSLVMVWMVLFKVPDAMEDIYYGEYQRKGRLDVGAKAMALRMLITIPFFGVMVYLVNDLLWTLIVTTCLTSILMVVFICFTYSDFREEETFSLENVGVLLRTCFPVFAGGFLSFYIGNAPKYAIDAYLNDELQACYGFISMPVFVIGLLNGFILNPMLYGLSRLWNNGKIKEFVGKILMLVCSTLIITLICVAGAALEGVPVLSFLYNTDLTPYKMELLMLLGGGGLLALSNVLNTAVVIMRNQKLLLIGYTAVAVLAAFMSDWMVGSYEMMGAALMYTSLMAGLCVFFVGIVIRGIFKIYNR